MVKNILTTPLVKNATLASYEESLRQEAIDRQIGDMYDKARKAAQEQYSKALEISNGNEEKALQNIYMQASERLANDVDDPQVYFKDKILRDMAQTELQKRNYNLFSMGANYTNSTLRGVQKFVADTENAVAAQVINNPYTDYGMKLAGATPEQRETYKTDTFNKFREVATSKGEKDIQSQLQKNEIVYEGIPKMITDAGFTVGNMAIPILAGIATGNATEAAYGAQAASRIAEAASLGTMYESVYGGAYTEAIDLGANTKQANMYANAIAGVEVGTELLGGETMLSLMVGRPTNSILGRLSAGKVSAIRNRLVKGLVAGFIDMGGESVEEAIAAVADPMIKKAILGGEDIDIDELMAGVYEDAVGAIIPTAIFMGIGKPALIRGINANESKTISTIRNADYLTDKQKASMIKKIQEVTTDAKWGINENYDKTFDAVYNEMNNSLMKNANIYNNVDIIQRATGINNEDASRLMEQQGFVFNPNVKTTQELLDKDKNVTVTYKNMNKVNQEIQAALKQDSDLISITPVTEITKVQENIKDLLEKKYPGKQVVYANIQSKEGTSFHGLTSTEDFDTIILDVSQDTKDLLGAAYHEVGHQTRISNPELYNEFIKKNGLEGENNPKVEQYRNENELSDYSDDAIREEMFGNYIGEINSKAENVKQTEDSTRTFFDNLKDLGNKIANETVGAERNNTRVSEYNLENTTYMNGDELNDKEFESKVVEEMNSQKSAEETKLERNLRRIRERLTELGNPQSKIEIDKAIADVLGIKYKLGDKEIAKYYRMLYPNNTKFSKKGVEKNDKKRGTISQNVGERTVRQRNNQESVRNEQYGTRPRTNENATGRSDSGRLQNNKGESAKQSLLHTTSNEQKLDKTMQEARKIFGTTKDYRVAGYVLPNGEMLDLSRNNTTKRGYSHSEVADALGVDWIDFMKSGVIRLFPEWGYIEIWSKPTNEQLEVIKDYVDNYVTGNMPTKMGYDGIYVTMFGKELPPIPPYTSGEKVVESIQNSLKKNSENNTKFSKESKKPKNLTIEKQNKDIEKLEKATNTLKDKNQALKETNKEQRADIRELEKLVKKDNRTFQSQIKIKGAKIENERGKVAKLTAKNQAAKDIINILNYEKTFIRHAEKSEYRFDRDDMDRYTMLRVAYNMNDSAAWKATLEFKKAMNYIPDAMKESLQMINRFLSPKVYNKLPKELQERADEYRKYYRKNIAITPAMMMNMKATSDYIKENLLGKVPLTKAVLNKILPTDEAPIALVDMVKTKEEADAFIEKVAKLDEEIKAEQARKIKVEDAARLYPKVTAPLDEENQKIIALDKKKPAGFRKTASQAKKQLYTLKTEIESAYLGNAKTPAMFFERNLQKGERNKREVIASAYDFLKDFTQQSTGLNGLFKMYRWKPQYEKLFSHKAEWNEWVKGTPRMPKSFILSLYAERDNQQNMAHITGGLTNVSVIAGEGFNIIKTYERKGGGIKLPNETLYRKATSPADIAAAYKQGKKPVVLTMEQVDALIKTLTPEEKAFADQVKKFYEYTTDLINEVSNRVYGYDIATVENYFPIHAYLAEQMYSNKEFDVENLLNGYKAELQGTNLFNQGQLKERTDSFSPVYLENIVDVFSKSVNDISTFYGYAEPLRENDIVLNTVFTDGKEREANSIRAQMDLIDPDLLNDYKTIVRFITNNDGFGKRTFRNWQAMNTLTFNVGTWLTQPASFANTYKYYSKGQFWKSLVNSRTKVNQMIRQYYEESGVDTSDIKNFDLMRMFVREATPVLDARGINFRMPVLTELTDKKLSDKMKARFLQFFDDIAVSTIVRMQIDATAVEEEFGSVEYFQKLADNIELILGETQPDSAQVNKANMFRNKSAIVQAMTLFGTPSNQIANNFVQSTIETAYTMKNGTKEEKSAALSKWARMIGGILAANLWVALVRSLRDVVRDDGEDEVEFQNRLIAQFLISTLSPTVVGDEVASWIMDKAKFGGVSFYEVDTPDAAFVNNVFGAGDKIANLFNENISPTKKTVDLIRAIGSVAPIDTRSMIHDTEAMLKWFFPDTYKAYTLSKNTNIYKAWKKNPDTPMAEFYDAYTATRQKELEKLGYHKADKEKGIESNLRETREKALQGVFKNQEDVDKYMNILFNYKT